MIQNVFPNDQCLNQYFIQFLLEKTKFEPSYKEFKKWCEANGYKLPIEGTKKHLGFDIVGTWEGIEIHDNDYGEKMIIPQNYLKDFVEKLSKFIP